jgi:polar amino acid transport system permease protein
MTMLATIIGIVQDNWLLLLIGQYPNGPLGGIAATLILSALGIACAFPLGVLMALAGLSPWRALRLPVFVLVYVARGTPLLMIILWVYFLLPLLIGRSVPGFVTMLVTLAIYEAAFISEIVRGGIQALPKGQMEAARSLGHSHLGAMRHVILPQALFNTIPTILSQFVSTIKETTLGYIINVPELTFAAGQINNRLLTKPFEVYAILAISYFVVCWTLTWLAGLLERRIAASRTNPAAGAAAPSLLAPRTGEA